MAQKEEKEQKNNTKYSGNFVSLQRLRAAHALRSDKLRASLAPARAEVVDGVVAKADQYTIPKILLY